jgi:hypothetical protein
MHVDLSRTVYEDLIHMVVRCSPSLVRQFSGVQRILVPSLVPGVLFSCNSTQESLNFFMRSSTKNPDPWQLARVVANSSVIWSFVPLIISGVSCDRHFMVRRDE